MRHLLFALSLSCLGTAAAAQDRNSHCIALADTTPGVTYLHKAAWHEEVPEFSVRINYIDHAMFFIQAATGETVATDYTGFLGMADVVPDVVTMNNSHETHWTSLPDPRIPHVLQGWPDSDGNKADYSLQVGNMLVRNVTTDTRSRFGPEIVEDGNSIFVFEIEGLCIGHMGHLHHEPDPAQYAALGRLDVVMVPVDGGFTIDRPSLISMLQRLRSSLVIPMHWFGPSNLERFLEDMAEDFVIKRTLSSEVVVSLRTLPPEPTILVLGTNYLRAPQ
ncbi:MBL fold metallo-hydrolase [Shimia ponticola]|uniref:MBL fold metallo-hydrolase n=1 Tax=Shimia ponticola TaxID=2582893 RepID=UPI0011BF6A13|nr:MBL fold metallo-hydrolase [Shimia ponticola]